MTNNIQNPMNVTEHVAEKAATNIATNIATCVTASINGQTVSAPPTYSLFQALWYSEISRVKGAGCLDGVCGSCRVMVRRKGCSDVSMELACQTRIEKDMQVVFPLFPEQSHHAYQLTDLHHASEVKPYFDRVFPEANQCRLCGGCSKACPKEIDVELGVRLAASGKFSDAGDLFIECVMCDICASACPEDIDPNIVGLFSRRVTARFELRPTNLDERLAQLRQQTLTVCIPVTSPKN